MTSATDEARVKTRLKAFFKEIGVYWFMPATHGYGRSGVPDFVVCAYGAFWGIECKGKPKDRTSALQRKELADILTAKGNVCVVDSENIDLFMEKFCTFIALTGNDANPCDWRREQDKGAYHATR